MKTKLFPVLLLGSYMLLNKQTNKTHICSQDPILLLSNEDVSLITFDSVS